MSHFTVLVIGDDVEGQLEKYNEQIDYPPYIKGEVDKEEKMRFMKYYQKKGASGTFEEMYEEHGDSWNGSDWKKNDKGVWEEWSTYNPSSKWDWFSIGGRWSGFFRLKNGADGEMGEKSWTNEDTPDKEGYVDMAEKGDIDVVGMRRLARARATKDYDTVASFFDNNEIPKLEVTWDEALDMFKKVENHGDRRDLAKGVYNAQEAIKVLDNIRENGTKKQKDAIGFFFSLEDYQCGREEYINQAGKSAISTYAVVKDGVWYQKGDMGWWGMTSNEMEQAEWDGKISEMIDEVSDDTMFTLVDCHI